MSYSLEHFIWCDFPHFIKFKKLSTIRCTITLCTTRKEKCSQLNSWHNGFLLHIVFYFIFTKKSLLDLFIQRFLLWISLVYNKKYANKVLRYLKTFRIQLFWITFDSELSVTFSYTVATSVSLRTWWCSLSSVSIVILGFSPKALTH